VQNRLSSSVPTCEALAAVLASKEQRFLWQSGFIVRERVSRGEVGQSLCGQAGRNRPKNWQRKNSN
jgi:hypothetical protein